MGKIAKLPYIIECELFKRIDFKHAEEVLAEYNDFYIYNLAQYNHIYHKVDECIVTDEVPDCELDEAKRLEIAERNAKMATDHFVRIFGSKDFGESAMVGFRPAWYDLQQILLEEYKHKTPVDQSAMNTIAPYIRNIATALLFAERVVAELESMDVEATAIDVIRDGFRLLLERVEKEKLVLPEYHKTKSAFNKFKKPEQYIEFCEKLFTGKLPVDTTPVKKGK